MVILGVDPSLRRTGYAVIEQTEQGKHPCMLELGAIENSQKMLASTCLLEICERLGGVIEKHKPQSAAIEGIIYVQSRSVAITLGAARGAALIAIAKHGVPIYEYATRFVKKATTGMGQAGKHQVGFMMRALFGLKVTPGPDEADALAIALTHAQSMNNSLGRLAIEKRI